MSIASQHGPDTLLNVKAVPGARRDQIAGRLGDRLKVRVAAPPEGGRANEAICALIAQALGLKRNAVSIERGLSHPEKTLRLAGVTTSQVEAAFPI